MEFFLWFTASLLVIGLVIGALIVVYQKAKTPASSAPREGDRGFERETRLFQLFQNIEDMMDGFDNYVEETRAALEMEKIEFLREKEEITRLHAQVIALLGQFREEVRGATEAARQGELALPARESPAEPEPPEAEEVPAEPAPEQKPQRPQPVSEPSGARAVSIWSLYCEGKNSVEIARELGMAHTEVSMTLKLLTGGKEA